MKERTEGYLRSIRGFLTKSQGVQGFPEKIARCPLLGFIAFLLANLFKFS
jgi:hypothetical protein